MALPPVLILRHVTGEPIGQTADALAAAGLTTELWDMAACQQRTFHPPHWAGLVAIGGPMNVDQVEQYPFLAQEIHWLREAVRAKVPVLGLCLGAQLLAKALGARVGAAPAVEVGWHRVEFTAAGQQDPLLSDIPGPATVLQWHGDTFELPAGAVLLAAGAEFLAAGTENGASGRQCTHQAFRFGELAWGIQFHAEIGAEQIELWAKTPYDPHDRCAPGPELRDQILSALPRELPGAQIIGRKILGRFGKLCREVAQARGKGNGG
ncbi:MAG: type 1 glutamine amidotransferase [Pirellulales bacterium]|nr:type 1 glutamine amidotransferase [Pirellulales bacterium]